MLSVSIVTYLSCVKILSKGYALTSIVAPRSNLIHVMSAYIHTCSLVGVIVMIVTGCINEFMSLLLLLLT